MRVLSIGLFLAGCASDGNAASGDSASQCLGVTAFDVPFCDDDSLPIAEPGCYDPCSETEPCATGSCTEAWVGCGPTADCDVCGVSASVCLAG